MNLAQIIDRWQTDFVFLQKVTAWKYFPAKAGEYLDFPGWFHPRLKKALNDKGITRLYSHQRQAIEAVKAGKNLVVVTPTASGKTLCYNLPVINGILEDFQTRALYIFPTKALSQDQAQELLSLSRMTEEDISIYTYDGDTPGEARRKIRHSGQIVVTNPDMLHKAILPHHTKWERLFTNLQYVVIDELHTYRGVFGSHMANVLRRLQRIAAFYGSNPIFITASATIANPRELAEALLEKPVDLIDCNGAPQGEKVFLFYNPPVVNHELGIRRSSLLESRQIAAELVTGKVQTILFARSRIQVEVLLTYLKQRVPAGLREKIRGYRGGYLPSQRREIEHGLREGRVIGVVTTNALELGIDIGQLQAAVINGYPGSIASTLQQAGRAGRRGELSLAVVVASSSPLDQYIINHPDYFFGRSPENALINPNNLYILAEHIKCAAFELPFQSGDIFGVETTAEVLDFLAENRILNKSGGRYYWMSESFPAEDVNLRSGAADNFVIIDIENSGRIIGSVDRFSAPMLIHPQAVYIHEGRQYQIERLDFDNYKAYARPVDVDYYTDANLNVQVEVLDTFNETYGSGFSNFKGEIKVTSLVDMFKKIKFETRENVGYGQVNLPPQEMHTAACWFALTGELSLTKGEIEAALWGLCNVLENLAPLFLLCDRRDIHGVYQPRSPFNSRPTIFIYDSVPGGIGLSDKFYGLMPEVLPAALELIDNCPCQGGCPSCSGAYADGKFTGGAQKNADNHREDINIKSAVKMLLKEVLSQ